METVRGQPRAWSVSYPHPARIYTCRLCHGDPVVQEGEEDAEAEVESCEVECQEKVAGPVAPREGIGYERVDVEPQHSLGGQALDVVCVHCRPRAAEAEILSERLTRNDALGRNPPRYQGVLRPRIVVSFAVRVVSESLLGHLLERLDVVGAAAAEVGAAVRGLPQRTAEGARGLEAAAGEPAHGPSLLLGSDHGHLLPRIVVG
mmetsp:Transcript_34955/g.83557  ORF Transcript_34955/g.83557 Transcript_34955/m.83557 type:complete len:204 (+) Transcript_34955:1246-1857(+)